MVLFAHLHSSPLVVRRSSAAKGKKSSPSSSRESNLQPVEIIDVKEERKLLLQCLKDSNRALSWRSEVADPHSFRKVVSYGCRALHFSGHGVNGKVIFENGKCEAHFLSQSELKSLLMAGGIMDVPMKLVFVSACHSESVSDAFVAAGVPHVVVVPKDDKVLDRNALEFSKAFYTALLIGHSVRKSFEIGQAQADICLSEGGSKFKLLGHGDHDEAIFDDLEPGSFINQTPPLPVNECDSVAEFFVGRSIEVHCAYTALVEGARLISLVGVHGVGKTEVALQCSQYATDRYLFQHIFFVRFCQTRQDTEPQSLVQSLAQCFGVEGNTINELAQSIRQKCVEGNFLVILDGCEAQIEASTETFRLAIALLLRRVPTLSFLLTTLYPLGGFDSAGERVIFINRLNPIESALLLSVRAPRKLKQIEIGGEMDLEALGMHPIVAALAGHPRAICAVAEELTNHELHVHYNKFLSKIIPAIYRKLNLRPSMEVSLDDYILLMGQKNGTYTGNNVYLNQILSMELIPVLEGPKLNRRSKSETLDTISSYEQYLAMASNGPPPPVPKLGSSLSEFVPRSSMNSILGEDKTHTIFLETVKRVQPMLNDREACFVWVQAVQMGLVMSNSTLSEDISTNLEEVQFSYLGQQLCRYFATAMQGDAVQRPLSMRSLEFLKHSRVIWGSRGNQSQRQSRSVSSAESDNGICFISVQMFGVFWSWFVDLLGCIKATGMWGMTSPRLIHGFLSKENAISLLRVTRPGTFLLRFSESRHSCIVIAYLREEDNSVQFVQSEYRAPYFELNVDGRPVSFPTLHQLVNSVNVLKFLYPNTPKEEAFRL